MLLTKLEANSLVPIHVELAKLRADKVSSEQVEAELATINQTITAHATTVEMQSLAKNLNSAAAERLQSEVATINQTITAFAETVNSAAAERNAVVDGMLMTKLEQSSLTTIHAELATLRQAVLDTINQMITSHAKTTEVEARVDGLAAFAAPPAPSSLESGIPPL